MPKEGSQFICLSVILIDSVFRTGKNYDQVSLKECKYVNIEKGFLSILLMIQKFSDSDEEILKKIQMGKNSDAEILKKNQTKKNSDQENFSEEDSSEKNQIEK